MVNIINPLIAVDKPLADENYELGFGYKTSGGELGTALKLSKSVDNFTIRGSGSLLSSGLMILLMFQLNSQIQENLYHPVVLESHTTMVKIF